MEELLIPIIQFIIEFTVDIICNLVFTFGPTPSKQPSKPIPFAVMCILFFTIGGLLAWLSILFFDFSIIKTPALRIVNLVVTPIAAAYISKAIAQYRNKTNPEIVPSANFWVSFWFTLGLVLVRFAYTTRT